MADQSARDAEIRAASVGEMPVLNGQIVLAEPDPAWPLMYAGEAAKIRAALGERVKQVEHVGSTSVPGLLAKPRIDILLVVADSAHEGEYIPALEATGYTLTVREPDWYEHRMLRGDNPPVNLHIFSPGCAEVIRMLLMRDWMRGHPEDRDLYGQTKRELAARQWTYTQHYADAKGEVVESILARATAAGHEGAK